MDDEIGPPPDGWPGWIALANGSSWKSATRPRESRPVNRSDDGPYVNHGESPEEREGQSNHSSDTPENEHEWPVIQPCSAGKHTKENQWNHEPCRNYVESHLIVSGQWAKTIPLFHPGTIPCPANTRELFRPNDLAAMSVPPVVFAGHIPAANIADVAISPLWIPACRELG